MSNLRKALLADHGFRYDIGAEQRADRAVAIVAAWLHDEAAALTTKAHELPHLPPLRDQARAVERLAASLTHTEGEAQ